MKNNSTLNEREKELIKSSLEATVQNHSLENDSFRISSSGHPIHSQVEAIIEEFAENETEVSTINSIYQEVQNWAKNR